MVVPTLQELTPEYETDEPSTFRPHPVGRLPSMDELVPEDTVEFPRPPEPEPSFARRVISPVLQWMERVGVPQEVPEPIPPSPPSPTDFGRGFRGAQSGVGVEELTESVTPYRPEMQPLSPEGMALLSRVQGGPRPAVLPAELPAPPRIPPPVAGRPLTEAEARLALQREGSIVVPPRTALESITQTQPLQALKAGATEAIEGAILRAATGPEGAPAKSFDDAMKALGRNPTVLEQTIRSVISTLSPLGLAAFILGRSPAAGRALATSFARIVGPKAAETALTAVVQASGETATAFAAFEGLKDATEQVAQLRAGTRESLAGGETLARMARGAAMGAMIGPTGILPGRAMQLGAEVGVFATAPAVLEGRLPTLQDVIDAGLLVGTLRLTGRMRRIISRPRVDRSPPEQALVDQMPASLKQEIVQVALAEADARIARRARAGIREFEEPAQIIGQRPEVGRIPTMDEIVPERPLGPEAPPTEPISEAAPVPPAAVIPTPPPPAIPEPPRVRRPAPTPEPAGDLSDLSDPDNLVRFIRARGGISPETSLKGEYRGVPLYLKSKAGLTPERMAEAISEAMGQPMTDAELLSRLQSVNQDRIAKRDQQQREKETELRRQEEADLSNLPEEEKTRRIAAMLGKTEEEAQALVKPPESQAALDQAMRDFYAAFPDESTDPRIFDLLPDFKDRFGTSEEVAQRYYGGDTAKLRAALEQAKTAGPMVMAEKRPTYQPAPRLVGPDEAEMEIGGHRPVATIIDEMRRGLEAPEGTTKREEAEDLRRFAQDYLGGRPLEEVRQDIQPHEIRFTARGRELNAGQIRALIDAEGRTPRFEATPEGSQVLIPGTEGRGMPPTPLRPEAAQKPIEETPLFGQERSRREREQEEGQGRAFEERPRSLLDKFRERRETEGQEEPYGRPGEEAFRIRPEHDQLLLDFEGRARASAGLGPPAPVRPIRRLPAGTRALGITPTDQLRAGRRLDFAGQAAPSAYEIGLLAQIARDPQIETSRFFYVKNGTVVGHEAWTSHLPGQTAVLPSTETKVRDDLANRLFSKPYRSLSLAERTTLREKLPGEVRRAVLRDVYRVLDRARRLGADMIYAQHNHPGGKPKPSTEDVRMTSRFANLLTQVASEAERPGQPMPAPTFGGHVIIDSGTFSVLEPPVGGEGPSKITTYRLRPADDPLLTPMVPSPLLGETIGGPTDVAKVGRMIQLPNDYLSAIFRSGSEGQVRAVWDMPRALLYQPEAAADALRGLARAFGGQDLFLYDPAPNLRSRRAAETLWDRGVIMDYVAPTKDVAEPQRSVALESGTTKPTGPLGQFGGPFSAFRTFEPGAPYETGRVPAEEGGVQRDLYDDLLWRPDDQLPKRAININLDRLDTPLAVKREINEVAEAFRPEIQEQRRGSLRFAEIRRLADDLGLDEDRIRRVAVASAWNAEHLLAARRILVSSAERLHALHVKVPGGSDADLAAFAQALQRHAGLQKSVSGLVAEAGRALSQQRILAEPTAEAYRSVIESLGGREITEDIARLIGRIDPVEMRQLNLFVQRAVDPNWRDMLFEAWISSILSGPKTHLVNMTSNVLVGLDRGLVERPVAGAIDWLRAKVTGTPQQRFMGEGTAEAYGIVRGVIEGVQMAGKAWSTEQPQFGVRQIEVRTPAIPGKLGRIIRTPLRALTAEDELAKAVAYRMSLNAMAYRTAAKEGHTGAERIRRMTDLADQPRRDMVKEAQQEATYRTFQKEPPRLIREFMRRRQHDPTMLTRILFPFVRTPTNIVLYGLERTPFNFARIAYKAGAFGKRFGPPEAERLRGGELSEELAKPVVGTLIAAGIVGLAASGLITGGGPSDPGKRRALRATGWAPYSFQYGGVYVNYGRLEPLGIIAGLAADAYESWEEASEEKKAKLWLSLHQAVAENVSNKTFLRGLRDASRAWSDPERFGQAWIEGLAASVVPNVVAQGARVFDPTLRNPKSVTEALASRIPGVSRLVPPTRDLWGRPVTLSTAENVSRLVSPSDVSSVKEQEPGAMEIVRLGVSVGVPGRKIGKIELTPDEHERYVELAGRASKAVVDRIVVTRGYARLPEAQKVDLLRDAIEKARRAARDRVLAEVPARERVRRMRRALGVGEAVNE